MAIQYVDKNCDAVGTAVQNFAITAGTNNVLQITVDGGSAQTITLTAGAARTAAQVCADINATLTGATAYAVAAGPQGGHVRIRTSSANGSSSSLLFGAPANNANSTLGFSTTAYTGASRMHQSWTQTLGTKQELINQIETYLDSCGWTTISGSGTTTLLLQSSMTPPGQDLQYRLRVKDNGGSCVTLSIENVAGTVAQANSTTSGSYLLPGVGKIWFFTANKYGGCIRTSTVTNHQEYAFFGCPALPTFLQGVIVECAFGHGDCLSDTATSTVMSFKWGNTTGNVTGCANQSMFVNGTIFTYTNNSASGNSAVQIFTPAGYVAATGPINNAGYRWHDTSILLLDALIGFGLVTNDDAKWRGYIWDGAVVSSTLFPAGATTTFDSNNWVVITDGSQYNGQYNMRCQLLLVTP